MPKFAYLHGSILNKLDQAEFYEIHGTPGQISHIVVGDVVIINSNLLPEDIWNIKRQYQKKPIDLEDLQKEIDKLRFEIDQCLRDMDD